MATRNDEDEKSMREWLSAYCEKMTQHQFTLAGDYAYLCKEDFVRRHGMACEAQPLPKPYRFGPIKRCFANSERRAKRHGLRYVEGFAVVNGFPIHHAWCVGENKRVIDVTLRAECVQFYFGVILPLRWTTRSKGNGALDDWPNKWPILRVPFNETES